MKKLLLFVLILIVCRSSSEHDSMPSSKTDKSNIDDLKVKIEIMKPNYDYRENLDSLTAGNIWINRLEEPPKVINIPSPEIRNSLRNYPYPICGITIVKTLIDVGGMVEKVEILKSCGVPVYDSIALETARKVKFTPGIHHGTPVRVWTSIPVKFSICDSLK